MTSAIDAKPHVLDPLLAVMVVAVGVGAGAAEDMVAMITVAGMVVEIGIDDAAGHLTEETTEETEETTEGVAIAEVGVGAETDGDKLPSKTRILT